MSKLRMVVLAFTSIIVIILDQITKHFASSNLVLHGKSIEVIKDFFHYKLVHNPGGVAGFLSGLDESIRGPLFIGISIVVIPVIIVFIRKLDNEQRIMSWSLSMVLGGAIGNMIDRFRFNYVVDFIDWHYYEYHWPTFNIADSAISIGAVLLLINALIYGDPKADKDKRL